MQGSLVDETTSVIRVLLLLTLSITMVSSASILILLSESPPLVIVFWRTLYGAIFMAAIGAARRDFVGVRKTPALVRNWPWLIGIGVVLSFHFSTWFQSLTMTSVAASVVLVDSSPIITAILSTLVLGEALRRRSWIGVVVAVLGATVLTIGSVYTGLGPDPLGGNILALLGAFFLAVYFIGGRKYAHDLPITVYTSIVYLTAASVTLALCIVAGLEVLVFTPREIVIFIALAIFPTVLGHSVNNYLLTKVPAYVISSAVLGEPIGATLLAFLVFAEIPGWLELAGFLVILLGVGLVLADIAARERSETLSLDDTDGSESDSLGGDADSI
ncbi:MAG: DMT family transporter [Candidatus Thorarchaeota archaeon]